jgi:hypothetical protein
MRRGPHQQPHPAVPLDRAPTGRHQVAVSFAHKIAILVAVVAAVVALWTGASHPVSPDATLGGPLVANENIAVTEAAVGQPPR